jgi:hypothetical protein
MLFYLDDFLSDVLDNLENDESDLIVAINNIAQSRREGKHIIFSNPKNLRKIAKSEFLSSTTKSIFKKIYLESTQVKSLFDNLKTYVKISATADKISSYILNDIEIIEIPLINFFQMSFVNETTLLCENLIDCELYEIITKYAKKLLNLGNVPIKMKFQLGGGNTTYKVFSYNQEQENQLCICVLDTDVKYKNGEFGDTIKLLKAVDLPNKPLCQLFEVECHEIENLIPVCIYEIVAGHDPNRLNGVNSLKKLEFLEARKFVDIKKGLRIFQVTRGNADQFSRYWHPITSQIPDLNLTCNTNVEITCTSKNNCSCYVFNGIGNNILSDVLEYLKSSEINFDLFDNVTKETWGIISEKILTWCCGSMVISGG